MRTRDLKEGVQYATCNGNLVEPVTPIHNKWIMQKTRSDGKVNVEWIDGRETKTDPWGNCDATTPSGKQGIRVKIYHVGALTASGNKSTRKDAAAHVTETVLRPGDIVGTWKEYMTLHGATHQEKVEEFRRDKRLKAEGIYLEQEIRESVLGAMSDFTESVSVYTQNVYDKKKGYTKEVKHFKVSFEIDIKTARKMFGK